MILELMSGCYFSRSFSTDQKKRLLSGIFAEYNRMSEDDIVTINAGSNILVLVLPRLSNQLAWELSLPNRSKHGYYSLIQSINIICERALPLDSPMRQQLSWSEEDVTIPFLTNFNKVIRLIG